MFEATLVEASFLKKVFDVIKDLVLVANIYCSATGLSLKASYCHYRHLQAKDSDMPLKDTHSDPYFVGLLLGSERFQHYKCDKDISRSIDIDRMAKILECAEDDDIITLKADDVNNTFTLVFESRTQYKISEFQIKFNRVIFGAIGRHQVKYDVIDEMPSFEFEYDAIVRMPSSEFARIYRNLSIIGDKVDIEVSNDGVIFSTKDRIGVMGTLNIISCQNTRIYKPEDATVIEMIKDPVSLSLRLDQFNFIDKATSLSSRVSISLSTEHPAAVVEYKVDEIGYITFYLKPTIGFGIISHKTCKEKLLSLSIKSDGIHSTSTNSQM